MRTEVEVEAEVEVEMVVVGVEEVRCRAGFELGDCTAEKRFG